MDAFSLSTSGLRDAAPKFSAEGRRLAQALADLRSTLDALGRPWGDDHELHAFASQYEENRPLIENAVGILSQGICSIDTCLAAAADNHDLHEQATKFSTG